MAQPRLQHPDAFEGGAGATMLERCHRDQPGRDDALRRRADGTRDVGVDVAAFLEPAARLGEAAANDEMRLACGPGADRAGEMVLERQAAAPDPGEVAAVVEFERDGDVIVT